MSTTRAALVLGAALSVIVALWGIGRDKSTLPPLSAPSTSIEATAAVGNSAQRAWTPSAARSRPAAQRSAIGDGCEVENIAGSRKNYRLFLNEPDSYKKYEYLATIEYDDIPGMEKDIYDQLLLYHGRLAFEQLLQEFSADPLNYAFNADRARRMLGIVAKMPCPPDANWESCIVGTLGMSRDEVERYGARATEALEAQNLARLRSYGPAVEPADAKDFLEAYDSVAPVLAQAIDGDVQTLRRFNLTATQAQDIVRQSVDLEKQRWVGGNRSE